MTSDLVYRMRTCAAALVASSEVSLVHRDAAELLAEASNLLDEPDDLGEPMEMVPQMPSQGTPQQLAQASPPQDNQQAAQGALWGDATTPLPTRTYDFGAVNPKPCPACGDIDIRKVRIQKGKLMLVCPRCAHCWEYKR